MKYVLIVLVRDDVTCVYELGEAIAQDMASVGRIRKKVREEVEKKLPWPRPDIRIQVGYVENPPATGNWEDSVVADIVSRVEE